MFEKYAPDAPANRVRITRNFVLSHPAHWIATFFGVGALRPAPGTWGTLAGVLVYGLLDPFMTREGWVALTAALLCLAHGRANVRAATSALSITAVLSLMRL